MICQKAHGFDSRHSSPRPNWILFSVYDLRLAVLLIAYATTKQYDRWSSRLPETDVNDATIALHPFLTSRLKERDLETRIFIHSIIQDSLPIHEG